MKNEMNLRYGDFEGPGVGKLYKAEVQSPFGWSHIGHYETVAAFEKLYDHLKVTGWDPMLDIHTYFDEEMQFTYRLRPIVFLREG